MVCLQGYLKVPTDGTYQFTLNGNGTSLLRLHDATVIDRSYPPIQPKGVNSVSGTVLLKAGYHPIRIYYHKEKEGKPVLNLSWQGPGIAEQPIPSASLFH